MTEKITTVAGLLSALQEGGTVQVAETTEGGNINAFRWLLARKDQIDELVKQVRDANPRLSYARTLGLTLADFRDLAEALPQQSSTESANWLRQTDVANMLGMNRYEVSRLVTNGDLQTNGLKRRECRIDLGSLVSFAKEKGLQINFD